MAEGAGALDLPPVFLGGAISSSFQRRVGGAAGVRGARRGADEHR